MTIVVCVRHPDHSNDFAIFDGDVDIYNIDLGASIDVSSSSLSKNDDEWIEFKKEWLGHAAELRDSEQDEVADYIEEIIRNNEPDS